MIIKKGYAQLTQPVQEEPATQEDAHTHVLSEQGYEHPQGDMAQAQQEPEEMDIYQGELSAEDFEAGHVPDRRQGLRSERRRNFRRLEDQELISQAHMEANAIRENAHQEGYEEGLRQAEPVVHRLTDELREAIQVMMDARERALEAAAGELGQMALDIARAVIRTEVTCDDELVMSLVHDTIRKVGRETKSIQLLVHPDEVMLVRERLKDDPEVPQGLEVQVMDDTSVEPGSCMIESRAGRIDTRFSTQLDIIERLLTTGGPA